MNCLLILKHEDLKLNLKVIRNYKRLNNEWRSES